jgi:hypothetical protein
MTGLVELLGQQLFSQRKAHTVGNTLAQRASGGFDTGGDAHFRVACGFAVQLAEVLQLLHGQVIACEVQQRINEHGAVAVGQHKAIAVSPMRVGGVVLQMAPARAPQHFGDVSHAHGSTGVAGVGSLNGVNRQDADGVGQLTVRGGQVECGGGGHAGVLQMKCSKRGLSGTAGVNRPGRACGAPSFAR